MSPQRLGSPPSLKERNRLQVVDALRRAGTASRADLARDTGLSRSTISAIVGELQDGGLVIELEEQATPSGAGGGRPSVPLALDPRAGTALGVDFGHTHLRVALADLSSHVIAERELAVDVDHSAVDSLDAAADLVEQVLTEAKLPRDGVIGVAMGLPGPIDAKSGVVGSSVILPGWAGVRPAAELEQRLGLPVEADNDANLGALGELTYGAGTGASDVVYVKIASGIGASLVIGGRVHRGATGVAGEIGHIIVAPEGRVCRCGNRGCLETVAASGPLLELLRPTHGESFDLAALVAQAAAGDVGCLRVLTDAGRSIGRALADLCNVLNPERLIIGGQLSAAGEPLLEGVRESLRRYALPAAMAAVEVRAGVLGDRAEVLGALRLVIADTDRLGSERLMTAA